MAGLPPEGFRVSRVEWGVILSLLLSAGSMLFSTGVIWTTVQQHSAEIATLQAKSDIQSDRLARIDTNVLFLAERAKEDREGRR